MPREEVVSGKTQSGYCNSIGAVMEQVLTSQRVRTGLPSNARYGRLQSVAAVAVTVCLLLAQEVLGQSPGSCRELAQAAPTTPHEATQGQTTHGEPVLAARLDLADGQVPQGVFAWGNAARLTVAEVDGRRTLVMTYLASRSAVAGISARVKLPPDANRFTAELRVACDTSLAIELWAGSQTRYQAFVALPAGQWQTVDMSLGEFWPSEYSEAEGPVEAARVTELRLVDLANLPGEIGLALGLKDGPQELAIRRLEFSRGEGRRRSRVEPTTAVVDNFDAGPVAALPIGGARLGWRPAGQGQELEIAYTFGGHRWAGIVVGIGHLPVHRLTGVTFRAHAAPAARLHVVLEEREGFKFLATTLLSSGDARPVELVLDRFRPGAPDLARPVNTRRLRVIILVADTFSTDLQPGDEGRFWVDDLALQLSPESGGVPATATPDGPPQLNIGPGKE
ncbi:MAG: CIA30 family protein [Armatimonadetes bacterium]|nr:CIA30 family protein [Armatimonadota bacterium]